MPFYAGISIICKKLRSHDGRLRADQKRAKKELLEWLTLTGLVFFTIHKVRVIKSLLKPDLKIPLSSSQDIWSKNKHLIVQKKCCHTKSEEKLFVYPEYYKH